MSHRWAIRLMLMVSLTMVCATVTVARPQELSLLSTPTGVEFGLLGRKGPTPAPTMFIFATDVEHSLTSQTYNRVGMILAERGVLCVSVALPYHPGGGLAAWAAATQRGEPWLPDFLSKVSQVLDWLIEEGYTDPRRVAVVGTSRGGFVAMHVAAADPRIACAVGFVPVTDLTDLQEFNHLRDHDVTNALSLIHLVDRLAGRPIFISIGNNDDRVNTDRAIAFTRAVVAASIAAVPPNATPPPIIDVELHVMPWPQHGGEQLSTAHPIAALWLVDRLNLNRSQDLPRE